jgi:hypothetical protein
LLCKRNGGGVANTGQSAGDQYDWLAHFPFLTISRFLPAEHGWQRREADDRPQVSPEGASIHG